jgi:dienelactone hydrolase
MAIFGGLVSRVTAAGSAFIVCVLFVACAGPDRPGREGADRGEGRGELVSVTRLGEIGADKVADYLRAAHLDASRARYGVVAERIEYRTVTPRGQATTASALVAYPVGTRDPLSSVSWTHGTTIYRGNVASVSATDTNRALATLFASAGYLTSAPDYLGMGTGPGQHPYLDVDSEAAASLDALRAARTGARRDGIRVGNRVMISGFSQGGPAAMALGRDIQMGADPDIELAALAPISGPYQLSATLATALDGGIEYATAYLSYFTVAWNRLHHLYDAPAEAFRDPTTAELFDGNHTDKEVFSRLPPTVSEVLTPGFIERLRRPTGELRQALAQADSTCQWRPQVPVHLFVANGDRAVPPSNSTECARQLTDHHALADVTDIGAAEHLSSATLSAPKVLALFDAAR